jgi:hypothetical protein
MKHVSEIKVGATFKSVSGSAFYTVISVRKDGKVKVQRSIGSPSKWDIRTLWSAEEVLASLSR